MVENILRARTRTKRLTMRTPLIIGITLAFLLLTLGGLLIASLTGSSILDNKLAAWAPIPLACTTRGCITSWSLEQQATIEEHYSNATQAEQPTEVQILTTLVRQFLIHKAEIKSPISPADARRYRQEILKLNSDDTITSATSLTPDEYDRLIVLPFLEQENLRQARHAESPQDVFSQLSKERWVIVLPFNWYWDKETAEVKNK